MHPSATSVAVQLHRLTSHLQVEVEEDEDPEGMYKKFRNSCNLSGVTYEVSLSVLHSYCTIEYAQYTHCLDSTSSCWSP